MKRVALVLAFSAVTALGAQWTGYVSDSKCGVKHADGSQASIDCVKGCVKHGEKPVLVVGDKVMTIANADRVPEALYGLKVTVKGKLKNGTVTVASIDAAK